jgi:hypothetical protein
MSHPTYTETCAWPGCLRAISWRHAFCYRQWRLLSPAERMERVAEAWRDR